MKKTRTMMMVLAASALIVCSALIAQGVTNRSFVSGTGSDGNNVSDCQQTAPCRTFQTAIGVTNPGGQVVALDSTGYSGFTINKSITIEGAPGQTAFIFVGSGFSGVTASGASTDQIVLRNLYIDGLGAASTTGLTFNGGPKLVVENCTFRSLTTGVSVAGTNTTTGAARMDVIGCDFYNNTTAVLSTGQGSNYPGNPTAASQSLVRLSGGNITGNGTAFFMANPGSGGGQPCANIAVFNNNANVIGNGTLTACSGGGCNANIINYSFGGGGVN